VAASPTQRTLKWLRDRGWIAGVVERRLPRGFTTIDLFGFVDIVAARPGSGFLFVQTTTTSNQAARLRKVLGLDTPAQVLAAGGRIQIHGWRKYGRLWDVTVREVTLNDLAQNTEVPS
jgi:hypothetical protein